MPRPTPIPGNHYAASWAPRIQLAIRNTQNTQRVKTTKASSSLKRRTPLLSECCCPTGPARVSAPFRGMPRAE
eukprot:5602256-Alexandrium_andersonii.AAC.1